MLYSIKEIFQVVHDTDLVLKKQVNAHRIVHFLLSIQFLMNEGYISCQRLENSGSCSSKLGFFKALLFYYLPLGTVHSTTMVRSAPFGYSDFGWSSYKQLCAVFKQVFKITQLLRTSPLSVFAPRFHPWISSNNLKC